VFLLTRALALLVLAFLIYGAINFTDTVQGTDFSTIVYTAARMIKDGNVSALYPDSVPANSNYLSFNDYAHIWLKHLPTSSRAIFLYPPLVGFLIKPLGYLSLHKAFLVWQSCSILALLLCSILISFVTEKQWDLYFFMSLLYAPIFAVLIEGQLDLVMVLLPLSIGYFLFMKGHPVGAGLAWSILALKPQFLPIILLLIASYVFAGRWKIFWGFMAGILGISAGSIICFGTNITCEWLASIKNRMTLEDYIYPHSSYLISGVPMALFERLPHGIKPALEAAIYILILGVFVHAAFICGRLIKRAGDKYTTAAPLIFVLAIFILPLISRYLLFYNLSIFAIAAMIIFGDPVFNSNKALMRDIIIAWCLIDLYVIGFSFSQVQYIQPPLLIVLLVWLYIRIVQEVRTFEKSICV